MKCPNCNVALTMSDRNAIEIDYCPDCRGVWLDRGELDKIIERSAQPPAQQPPAPQQSNYPTQERYYSEKDKYYSDKDRYYKKKKGLLGDLFDF